MTTAIGLFTRSFYFLRHGETELNARGLIAGSLETGLTESGRAQALQAAAILATAPITHVYSSPMRRALDTAEPIAQKLQLPVIIVPELAERFWGELEGKPRGMRMRGAAPPGGEPTEQFTNRVLAGFARIHGEMPLVVAHSGIFRVLCRTLRIVESEAPVTNALPLHFVPLPQGEWRIEPASAVAR